MWYNSIRNIIKERKEQQKRFSKKVLKIGIKKIQTDYNSIRNKTKKKGTTKNKKVKKRWIKRIKRNIIIVRNTKQNKIKKI